MKAALLTLLCCVRGVICHAETPQLFLEGPFNAADLARAVNHFVALGEKDAVRELTELAPDSSYKRDRMGRFIDPLERVSWVCRILFQPKTIKPLGPPIYIGTWFPYDSMPLARWPLFPIAHTGSSYFVLSQGRRSIFGTSETPQEYLADCRKDGVFRKRLIPVPTRAQALRDASELRQSPAWRAIKWGDNWWGLTHSRREAWIWESIQRQADSIQ